jgi:hypothetical protein
MTLIIAPAAWFMGSLNKKINELQVDLYSTRETLARDYVSKGDFGEDIRLIMKRFDRLEQKIDGLK